MIKTFTHHSLVWAVLFGFFCQIPGAYAQFVAQDINFPSPSTGVNEIVVVDVSTVWATGYDGSAGGGIFKNVSRTSTGGLNWQPRTLEGTASDDFGFADLFAFDASNAWAAMVDQVNGQGELYQTTDGGATWSRRIASRFTGTTSFLNAVHFFSPSIGVVMGDPLNGEYEIYRTTDGGVTWAPQAASSIPNPLSGEFSYTRILKGVGQSGWFGTSQGRVYRTVNAGASWTVATTGLTDVNLLSFTSATNGIAVDVNTTGGIVGMARTTDGGATWTLFTPTGTVFASDLQAVPGSDGHYISVGATTGASGSSFTRDNGNTWTLLEAGLQRTAVGAANASNVWVGNFTSTTGTGGILKGALPNSTTLGTPPAWSWARRVGSSSSSDYAFETAIDATGNVYVVGRFVSSTNIGGITLTSAGGSIEGYLAKFNAAGTALWAVPMGGSGGDQLRSVSVDASGNVYASGVIQGQASIPPFSAGTGFSDFQAVVIRYDPTNGDAIWVRVGGGIGYDEGVSIGTDGSGNVYVGGAYDSTGTSFGGTSLTHRGRTDGFLVSYSPSGTFRWVRSMASNSRDVVSSIAVRASGGVVVGGTYGDEGVSNVMQVGSTTLTSAGGTDGFIANYTSTGTLNWARVFGGVDDDGLNGLAINAAGTVFGVGYFASSFRFGTTNLIPTAATPATADILTFSYSAAGAEGWTNVAGGPLDDSGFEIALDASDNLYITGFYQGTAIFGPGQLTSVGSSDVFVASINNAGNTRWITSAGGTGSDVGRNIAIDPAGPIYLAGSHSSPTISFGTFSQTLVGGIDGFLAKLGSTTCTLATPTLTTNSPVCEGQTLTLNGADVGSGNTITISGPNGFSSSNTSGSISNVTSAAAGTYTILVSSSVPGCTATNTANVVVNQRPAAPTAQDASVCVPGRATLTATNVQVGSTVQWFNAPTGGTLVGAGATYITPILNGPALYYAQVTSAGGCASTRTMVTINTITPPTPTLTPSGPTTFCEGGSVPLVATGLGGTGSYLWSTGQATSSITATTSGSYTVSIVLTPGCSATSAPVVVTVNPRPASPTASSQAVCAPSAATLTALNVPPRVTVEWLAAPGQSPLATGNTYTTPVLTANTQYYVQAVSDEGCRSTPPRQIDVQVFTPPTPTLTAGGPTSFCQGGQVTLTATGAGTGGRYVWSSGETTSSILATTSGNYTVTAISAAGCSTTTSAIAVTVQPTPQAPQVTGDSRCGGGSVTLTATGAVGNATYAWYTTLNGAAISGANGSAYTTPALGATTTYYVSITDATSSCTSPRVPVVATVSESPTVSLTAAGPTTFCSGNSVTLNVTGTAGANFQFLRGGIPIVGGAGSSYVVRDSGRYAVVATTAAACSTTSSVIRVNVLPAADATFSYTVSTLCLTGGGGIDPIISGNAGGTFSASPAGLVLDATTGRINIAGSQAGTYAVSYSVSGACPATASQTITVTAAPLASFSYAVNSVCADGAFPLSPILGAGSSVGSFTAVPAGLGLSAVTGVVNPLTSQPGVYTVTNSIPASGTCPAAVGTASFTIKAVPATPVINATTQGGVLLTSSAPTGNQWFRNGQPVVGANGVTLLINDPANNGDYTVQVTVDGCTSGLSNSLNVVVVGLQETRQQVKLTVKPNPTTEGLTTVSLSQAPVGGPITLALTDALGRIVFSQVVVATEASFNHALDLNVLPKGVYMLQAKTGTRLLTHTVVKQ